MTFDDGTPVPAPRVEAFGTAVLSEGDCLYLPPGTWHTTEAVEDSVSLSLSPPRTPVFHLVMRVLQDILLQRPEWRRDLLAPDDEVEPGKVHASVAQTLSSRLDELKALLNGMDPRVFHRVWLLNVEMAKGNDLREEELGRAVAVQPSDRLARATAEPLPFIVAPSDDGKEALFLYHRRSEWCLPMEAASLLARLATIQDEFLAESARDWDAKLGWEDISAVLSQLVAAGILRRRTPA